MLGLRVGSTTASAIRHDHSQRAERQGWSLRRLLAPFAVGIALLSALLTFVVLTGLTPMEPPPEVVRSFLAINAVTIRAAVKFLNMVFSSFV